LRTPGITEAHRDIIDCKTLWRAEAHGSTLGIFGTTEAYWDIIGYSGRAGAHGSALGIFGITEAYWDIIDYETL
jgi:hypothetical protein